MNEEALREPMSRNPEPKKVKDNPFKAPLAFIVFAALCFATALYLNGSTGKKIKQNVPSTGELIGPIKTNKDGQVYAINFSQNVAYGTWSSVSIDVLDDNKKFLYSFGKEFWAERGYDGGHWTESKTKSDTKITFKKKGTYYLKLSSKSSKTNPSTANISISIDQKRGSHLPHLVMGIFSLIVGILYYVTIMGNDGKKKLKESASTLFIIVIICLFIWLDA